MAGLHQQQRVAAHERRGHRHLRAVGKAEILVAAEFLDAGKNVVPAADVEPGGVILQFPEEFIHLESGDDRLDQAGGLDGSPGQAQGFLGNDKNLVPQSCFEVRLHLRQVEVRPAAARQQFLRVVEEVEREIEDAAGHRLAVDGDVLLVEMPAARPRQQHRELVVQLVALAARVEGNRAAHRVAQVDLPVDHVEPGRAVGVLEVRHEGGGAAVERVDHHLAVGRPGDLDAPVEHVLRLRRNLPVRVADLLRLGQEIRQLAGVEFLLARRAAREQFLAARLELAVQLGDERERPRRQDRRELGRDRRGNLHAVGEWIGSVHGAENSRDEGGWILRIGMTHRNMEFPLRLQWRRIAPFFARE